LGYFVRRMSTEPSREALSTTITWNFNAPG
jgi:hypothetical protein